MARIVSGGRHAVERLEVNPCAPIGAHVLAALLFTTVRDSVRSEIAVYLFLQTSLARLLLLAF
jgi:hypothetical protein